jgi:glycosyltransferase involved in cell wall biosynthesis
MKVSVVVCAYSMERYDDVCEAVESVLAQTYEDIEIILIIDGNEALLERLQSEFGNQEATTLRCNEENKGLSYSRTRGVELATGSVIAFLDDDAIAEPDWIEELVRGYEETDAIAVGGRMVPEWIVGRPSYLPEEFNWLVGANYERRLDEWTEVRNTLGSNMSFRRDVFEETGGFDEQMGLKGDSQVQSEETELAMRMYDTFGQGMLYNPDAVVAHKVFDYRTNPRWLCRRAFWQGYSKRALKQLDVEGPGDAESEFLEHLLFSSVPRRISGLTRRPSLADIQQLLMLFLLTACVGFGYLYGIVRYQYQTAVDPA